MLCAVPVPPSHMAEASSRVIVQKLLDWFQAEGRDWPWRQTRDRWRILVSEVCLQQTQVHRAAPYIERILHHFPEPGALAAAPLAHLLELWQGLGYPRRARNLHHAANIVHEHGWPEDYRTLPGVGPYTDAALRCFADEEPVVPPDINTRRVLTRLFPDGPPTADSEPLLDTYAWSWGQAVMELGQRVCTARAQCDMCPLLVHCPSAGTTDVIASAPQKRYAGSMRQRRGMLMRELVDTGRARIDADPEAARSLAADGLCRIDEAAGLLLPAL
jgi:A/G-specific adenine glycosylase